MKFLEIDEARTLDGFQQNMEDGNYSETEIRSSLDAFITLLDLFETRPLTERMVLSLDSVVDQDGKEYKNVTFVISTRWIEAETTYLSDGHFAIDFRTTVQKIKELVEDFFNGSEGHEADCAD